MEDPAAQGCILDIYRGVPFVYLNFSDDVFFAIPLISVAFSAHYNVQRIYFEMGDSRTTATMNRVIASSVATSITVYAWIAFFGYLAFRESLLNYDDDDGDVQKKGDILTYLQQDSTVTTLCRLGLVITVIFSYPLVQFANRNSFLNIVYRSQASAVGTWAIRNQRICSSIVVPLTLVIAIFVPDITVLFSFTGSSSTVLIIYIMPALVDISLSSSKKMFTSETLAASLLIVFGVIFSITGLTMATVELI